MMESVELKGWEWDAIDQMAEARLKRWGSPTSLDQQRNGVAGEWATRSFFSLPSIIDTGADGGVDLQIAGRTCDVKATRAGNALLILQHDGALRADIAILTLVDWGKKVDLAGWISKEDFKKRAQDKIFRSRGNNPCRVVAVQGLNEIKDLKAMIATIKENTLHPILGSEWDPDGFTDYLSDINGTAEIVCPDFAKALTNIGDDLGVVVDEWRLAISETGTVVVKPVEFDLEEDVRAAGLERKKQGGVA